MIRRKNRIVVFTANAKLIMRMVNLQNKLKISYKANHVSIFHFYNDGNEIMCRHKRWTEASCLKASRASNFIKLFVFTHAHKTNANLIDLLSKFNTFS